jgi:hypothetical protein
VNAAEETLPGRQGRILLAYGLLHRRDLDHP